jgi:hypothetical protein
VLVRAVAVDIAHVVRGTPVSNAPSDIARQPHRDVLALPNTVDTVHKTWPLIDMLAAERAFRQDVVVSRCLWANPRTRSQAGAPGLV